MTAEIAAVLAQSALGKTGAPSGTAALLERQTGGNDLQPPGLVRFEPGGAIYSPFGARTTSGTRNLKGRGRREPFTVLPPGPFARMASDSFWTDPVTNTRGVGVARRLWLSRA